MTQKLYLNILKFGVYLSLTSVFLVYKTLLFPFISSKQISFNILIELLFIVWISFIYKYRSYIPKKSYISFGLLAYFAVVVLSCFTGVDFNLSFWGDVERMLGAFHLLHFLALYFIIITVFRTWKDWKNLLRVSLFFAVLVCAYGYFKDEAYATIGNTAYVAGYMIFALYFAVLLFFKSTNWYEKSLYLLSILVLLWQFFRADASGAYVGLFFSIMVALFLYGVLSKNKKIKIATISSCILLVAVSALLLANKDSEHLKSTPLDFVSEINLEKNTFQTRLISWRAGIRDLKEHPLLGTGHGNYAIIFDKYFDPSFYTYTSSETYFDRAHNNLIDIVSTTGILGLLTYLSFLIALAYYLVKGYREGKINIHEFVLISSLITAYFVQNLAVFDSLVTYISLMITLAFVYSLYNGDQQTHSETDENFNDRDVYVLVFTAFLMFIVMYHGNIKPLKMLFATIDAQIMNMRGDFSGAVDKYKEALSYDSVLDRDSRGSLSTLVLNQAYNIQKLSLQKREEIFDFTIAEIEKNIALNPDDSLTNLQFSQLLITAAQLLSDNKIKSQALAERSREAIDRSIISSPGRLRIYYQESNINRAMNDKDAAIASLQKAIDLNPNFNEPYCKMSNLMLIYSEEDQVFKYGDKCIDMNGLGRITNANIIKAYIERYTSREDMGRVAKLYERLVVVESKNVQLYINLAIIYKDLGQIDQAEKTIKRAIEADPKIKREAEAFLRKLNQ